MTTPEILPCPWCGSGASMYGTEEFGYGIACDRIDCHSTGPDRATKAEAIAAWNRVAAMPAMLEIAQFQRLLPSFNPWSDLTETPNPKEKE